MNNHNNIIAEQYDIISESFDNTRVRIWKTVTNYLNNINEKEKLLDVGCGNGKNMLYAQKLGYECTGIDISKKLINICKEKKLNVEYSDILNYKSDDKYNKIIAIAVLHHLENIDKQKEAILIMINILEDNGILLVSFWSKEKEYNIEEIKKNKKDYRDFKVGANYVSWKLNNETIIKRFYYIHDNESINNLVKSIGYKYEITWELQNWFIKFYK